MDTTLVAGTQVNGSIPSSFFFLVLVVAFLAWAYRSLTEAEPDPFILNLTFFASAGQLILSLESFARGHIIETLFYISLVVWAVSIGQIAIFRMQSKITRGHFETLFRKNLLEQAKNSPDLQHSRKRQSNHSVEYWARTIYKITGVDFFPEFYEKWIRFRYSYRAEMRKLAYEILPSDLFNKDTFEVEDLKVPRETRRWPWRTHVFLCVIAWTLFYYSVGKAS